MSRIGTGEQIPVRPQSNVYTAMLAAALVVQILGFIAILIRARDVGGLF